MNFWHNFFPLGKAQGAYEALGKYSPVLFLSLIERDLAMKNDHIYTIENHKQKLEEREKLRKEPIKRIIKWEN